MSATPHHDAENTPKELKEGTARFTPRQLNMVWGNDSRYWKVPAVEKARDPAELLQVCWLEVSGSFPCVAGVKKYKISFTISLKPDAFGWSNCPVYVMAKQGKKGKYIWKKVPLTDHQEPKWVIGDLEIDVKNDEPIFFGLYEVWSGKWKGGLVLHEATVIKVD